MGPKINRDCERTRDVAEALDMPELIQNYPCSHVSVTRDDTLILNNSFSTTSETVIRVKPEGDVFIQTCVDSSEGKNCFASSRKVEPRAVMLARTRLKPAPTEAYGLMRHSFSYHPYSSKNLDVPLRTFTREWIVFADAEGKPHDLILRAKRFSDDDHAEFEVWAADKDAYTMLIKTFRVPLDYFVIDPNLFKDGEEATFKLTDSLTGYLWDRATREDAADIMPAMPLKAAMPVAQQQQQPKPKQQPKKEACTPDCEKSAMVARTLQMRLPECACVEATSDDIIRVVQEHSADQKTIVEILNDGNVSRTTWNFALGRWFVDIDAQKEYVDAPSVFLARARIQPQPAKAYVMGDHPEYEYDKLGELSPIAKSLWIEFFDDKGKAHDLWVRMTRSKEKGDKVLIEAWDKNVDQAPLLAASPSEIVSTAESDQKKIKAFELSIAELASKGLALDLFSSEDQIGAELTPQFTKFLWERIVKFDDHIEAKEK